MFATIVLFILGFIFLIKGADLLVDGASAIAKKHGISNLVIGLTIVAFGTSTPELIISSMASFKGSAGVALGNVIGSNIVNTLLILGVAAIINDLLVKRNTVNKEIPLSLLAVIAVGFMVNDVLIDGVSPSSLTRIDGLILILFFGIFIYYTFGISKDDPSILDTFKRSKEKISGTPKSVFFIMVGLLGLYFGGQWIVNGAIVFAKAFKLSEALIGLTIVSIGTSLPELAASGMAAYRGKTDIAVGNVIGSNIFNMFWVLGVSAIIKPIPYVMGLNVDFVVLFGVTILLFFLIYVGKRNIIARLEGGVLLVFYVCYLLFVVMRG
jgi:cation:H+ antiporter